MTQERRKGFDEARRFARVTFDGRMVYRYAADVEGTAQVSDVSRGGMRMCMGRYLRPGTRVMLEADGVRVNGQPVELKCQIVWCTPEKRGHRFVAGIRIIYDEPDAIAAASALVNHALFASGVFAGLPEKTGTVSVAVPVWPVQVLGAGTRAAARFAAGNA